MTDPNRAVVESLTVGSRRSWPRTVRRGLLLLGVTSLVVGTAAYAAGPASASGPGTIGLVQSYQGAAMTYAIVGNSELQNSADGAGGFNTDHCGDGNSAGTVGGVPTSATLALPSDAVVKGAYLWWTAMTAEDGTPTPNVAVGATASLTMPSGAVHAVTSTQDDVVVSGATYEGQFADISSIIPTTSANGRYTLPIPGGINLTECSVGYNVRNWQMMVIYTSPSTVVGANKVYVYSGLQGLDSGNITVPVTGYDVPTTGSTAGRLSVMFSDGDSAIPGETLTSTDATFLPTGFPPNYGNSSGICGPVNTAGTADCETATLPPSGTVAFPNDNQFSNAWDVDEHDGSFTAGSTNQTLTVSTSGDVLIFDGIALQAPTALLQVNKTTTTTTVASGGTASYTITATDPSLAGITGVTLTDSLPAGFTYAGLAGVTLSGGATRPTVVNPSPGGTALQFGTFDLPAGASVSVTFTATAPSVGSTTSYQNIASATVAGGGTPIINQSDPVGVSVSAAIAAASVTAPSLPATGASDAPQLTYTGMGLLVTGLALVLLARRRGVRL